MANCYRCGRHIDNTDRLLRRRVKTGEWARYRTPHKYLSAYQTHFGMRVVCSWCAKTIDGDDLRKEMWSWALIVVALILLAVFLSAFR